MRSVARVALGAFGAAIAQDGVGLVVIVSAASIWLQPDRILRTRAFALLATAFVCGIVTVAIQRFGAGLVLYPRRLRLRIELEDSLFDLLCTSRAGQDLSIVADRLVGFLHIAPAGPWRDRISVWQAQLRSGEPDVAHRTSAEMNAALREFPTHAGERMPLGLPAMVPARLILRVSVMVAVVGALMGPLSPMAPLVSLSTLFSAVVLFAVSLALLRFLRVVSCKVHDIRSKAGFRTIVVTDKDSLSRLGAAAVSRLYAQIGHVVVIFGDVELDDGIMPHAPGAYFLRVGNSGIEETLAAFAPHADLLVVDTIDPDLTGRARTIVALPPTRYLALSRDGVAPSGYRWVDPRTLFIMPSDRRARMQSHDPYLRGIRRDGRVGVLLGDLALLICVASAVFFTRVPYGGPLAIFFALGALCQILPEVVGPWRAGSLHRTMLSVPSAPEASRVLMPRRFERRLWVAAGLVWAASAAYFALRAGFHPNLKRDPTLYTLAVAAYLFLIGGRSIVNGILILRKWSLDWKFRIVVLRRNWHIYGYGHKAFVMVTCGTYGQVVSLQDYSLDRTDDDYGEWRESSLGSWFPIFSQIQHTLKPNAFLHIWQRQVQIELEVADFAVFDWIEEVTDNMWWELAEALIRLPAGRLLIICNPEHEATLTRFIDARLAADGPRPHILLATRGRDDQYIWADHGPFDTAFKAALYESLVALAVEPRPSHTMIQAGAWAFPCPADKSSSAA